VCEALQLCCWLKPKNRKVWIPHQNSKEHSKSLRERVGREVEKAKSWKLELKSLKKGEEEAGKEEERGPEKSKRGGESQKLKRE
jgi:hypothetical protein